MKRGRIQAFVRGMFVVRAEGGLSWGEVRVNSGFGRIISLFVNFGLLD